MKISDNIQQRAQSRPYLPAGRENEAGGFDFNKIDMILFICNIYIKIKI